VSNLPEPRPEDPGKRMEPFTGEFTFKTNSVSYLFIYISYALTQHTKQ
jgi:hypothetical protein